MSKLQNTVEAKYKRNNKILFNQQSECLVELISMIEQSSHQVLIKWSLDQASTINQDFMKDYPEEKRPQIALEQSFLWAQGMIKMAPAKQAILACHAVAKEIKDKKNIAQVHAIGQAASTVHVKSHALGLVFYELSSIVFGLGLENYKQSIDQKIEEYINQLNYWNHAIHRVKHDWASFLREQD